MMEEGGGMVNWEIKFKDVERCARSFAKIYWNWDVGQYIKNILDHIEKNKDIVLKDGKVLKERGEKMKFLEEELRRAISHFASLEYFRGD